MMSMIFVWFLSVNACYIDSIEVVFLCRSNFYTVAEFLNENEHFIFYTAKISLKISNHEFPHIFVITFQAFYEN